jgi:SAM-dependent methyltransferase
MIKTIRKKVGYYLFASYRRKILDKLRFAYTHIYSGKVLDIGGRQKGSYCPPKEKVEWITADIVPERNPDIVLDVADMRQIESESFDGISAIELFEHVEKIEDGIRECHRILKGGGKMILSAPFLYPFHADPWDFQRWTAIKWKQQLKQAGFKIEKIEITGRIFCITADSMKTIIESLPLLMRPFGYLTYPLLDCIACLDNSRFVVNKNRLRNYHGGYFIIAKKETI